LTAFLLSREAAAITGQQLVMQWVLTVEHARTQPVARTVGATSSAGILNAAPSSATLKEASHVGPHRRCFESPQADRLADLQRLYRFLEDDHEPRRCGDQ